jgi:H+/Cl- antiporter ClcA
VLRGTLNDVPSGLLLVAVVGATCGGVVLAVWLVRRYVPATREEFNSEIVAAMLGVLAALFGLAARIRRRDRVSEPR